MAVIIEAMSRQLRLHYSAISSTSKSTVNRSVTDDSSQLNKSQYSLRDSNNGHSASTDCSQSACDHGEGSDCEEETDQNVHAATVAKSMLSDSVKVHTEPPSDLAFVPTESPTQPKIYFHYDSLEFYLYVLVGPNLALHIHITLLHLSLCNGGYGEFADYILNYFYPEYLCDVAH